MEQLGMFYDETTGRTYDFSEDNAARERAYEAEERRKERIMDEYWETIAEKRREQWRCRD